MQLEERRRLRAGIFLSALILLLSWERLRPAVSPLLTGLCLALFLDPLCGLLESSLLRPLRRFPARKRLSRIISIFLILFLAAACLLLLFWQAGPRLAQSLGQALELLPQAGESLGRQAESLSRDLTDGRFQLDLSALPDQLLGGFVSGLTAVADQLANGCVNFLLGAVFAVWMLLKKEAAFSLLRRFCRLFPSLEPELWKIGRLCCRSFSAFVKGQLTEAVILGTGCFVGMLLFHKPFSGLISLAVGITALVPVAGALVGGAFGVLLLFSQSPADGLWFLIFIVLLQQLENNLIYPRVMGQSVGLPAALVLLSVLLGGALFGIPGMLLFVPAVSTLWLRMQQDIRESPPLPPPA